MFCAVPTPEMSLTADGQGVQYTGTNLTLSCAVTFNEEVGLPTEPIITWRRDGELVFNIEGGRVSIVRSSLGGISALTMLVFYPLTHKEDGGLYSCSVEVNTIEDYPHVEPLNSTNIENVTVEGKGVLWCECGCSTD